MHEALSLILVTHEEKKAKEKGKWRWKRKRRKERSLVRAKSCYTLTGSESNNAREQSVCPQNRQEMCLKRVSWGRQRAQQRILESVYRA